MNNLEYIEQARKLLTEDYKTKHSNEYNSWLARCKDSWMQPHTIVPFPPFVITAALVPFKASVSAPSEEAVVAKALELYKQFNPTPVVEEKSVKPVVEEKSVKPVVEEKVVEPVVEEKVVEPVVEEIPVEPVVEEKVVEPVVEEIPVVEEKVVEPVATTPLKNTDAIYKIFQNPVIVEPVLVTTVPVPPTIEAALNVIPQPAEELAKVKTSGRILPSVLEKLQAMKDKWSKTEEKHV